MNCQQARTLFAINREIESDLQTKDDLAIHLSHCKDCQKAEKQFHWVGEQIRALPAIEPAPDAHDKLMQALAKEHLRFLDRAPKTPVPAFLAPHLKELARSNPQHHRLAAFATAHTTPLPIVVQPRKHHHGRRLNHSAIIGIAASFLIAVLFGSLTSLLMLTQHGDNLNPPSLSLQPLNDVRPINYNVMPFYHHIASASANGHTIYYTSYNDQQTNWQLEQFDEKSHSDTTLLTTPSTQELMILGNSADWLIWLQIDPPKIGNIANPSANNPTPTATPSLNDATPQATPSGQSASAHDGGISSPGSGARAWTLHARYLGALPSQATSPDRQLISQTFNPADSPNWLTSPLQGIWLTGNTLLVAMVDEKGSSHLQQYQLDPLSEPVQTEIAHGDKDHVLASPTATTDGTAIYWADEYFSDATAQLTSSIWTQQTADETPTNGVHGNNHQLTQQYLFRADGNSFDPQIVNDTLFLLSTSQNDGNNPNNANSANSANATSSPAPATPEPSPTPLPTIVPTTVNIADLAAGADETDPRIFTPQIDSTQIGRILTFTAHGAPQALPQFDSNQMVTAPRAGNGFLLWQKDNGTFGMYDLIFKVPVHIGNNVVPSTAIFLAVNGDTAISVANSNSTPEGQNNTLVTFHTFRWPTPRS